MKTIRKFSELTILLFLFQTKVKALALTCYSCNGTKSCSNTAKCPDSAGYRCHVTTFDDYDGVFSHQVTYGGCVHGVQCIKTPNPFCIKKRNCQTRCCSTNNCNRKEARLRTASTTYPRCYECMSPVSFDDCQTHANLRTCQNVIGKAYCFKANTVMVSYTGKKKNGFTKGCTSSLETCSKLREPLCRGSENKDECKIYCCTGNACNEAYLLRATMLYPCLMMLAFLYAFASK